MTTTKRSPVPINIRVATTKDSDSISILGTYVFKQSFGYSMPATDLEAYLIEAYSLTATVRELSDVNKDMLVATTNRRNIIGDDPDGLVIPDGENEDAEVIVGFLLLTRGTTEPFLAEWDHSLIELQRIYVHPSVHGIGVGKKLALAAEDMSRSAGFKYMWLGVWEENYAAQKVYQKLGYEQKGIHGFKMGECIQYDHVMLKTL